MKYYTLAMLEHLYRQEHPELTAAVIKKKAKDLHKQLNTMDVQWKRSNRRFYQNLDFFENDIE